MIASFTDWNPNELAHYGIPGMKWGVRKLAADKYARPSGYFKSRYIPGRRVNTVSPRLMQRHFNGLDKSYSNIAYRKHKEQLKFGKQLVDYSNSKKDSRKYKLTSKKIAKTIDRGRTFATQMFNIEAMQTMIAGHAAGKNYSVKSKPVTRTYGNGYMVKGQKVKIRENGKSTFTMYKNGNPYDVTFKKNGEATQSIRQSRKRSKGG